jgi:hypothetical protein
MSDNGNAPTSVRKNHGRNHSYYIDGAKVPGITTALNKGFPKPALVDWAAGATADYALDHWDELGELSPSKRHNELKRARFETQDEAKLRGTLIHKYAHQLAAGEEILVPDEYRDHVDRYLDFVRDWEPRELLVERPFFSRTHRYAGTPDLVAELVDGAVWMLDWKTGAKHGVYLEHVLQLAAARFAEYVVDDTGAEVPPPAVDRCGIVWLRADGYDLYPVEADARAFALFRMVLRVAEYIEAGLENVVGDALLPPELELEGVG